MNEQNGNFSMNLLECFRVVIRFDWPMLLMLLMLPMAHCNAYRVQLSIVIATINRQLSIKPIVVAIKTIMSSNNNDAQLKTLHANIQALYDFRDSYFLNVPEEKFANKECQIDSKVNNILEELNLLTDIEDKATYYFLKGWLLNIKNTYDKNVFDLLTKSIKLKPNFEEAWIELGECYFKKGDLKLALNCFETVIKQNATEKKALRNASIILRSLPSTKEEKLPNILKSIELAKKSVECDLNDGNSWAVLGNAYLTLVFISSRDNRSLLIKNCKSAYQKAVLDNKVKTKSDILYNYASILQYEEEFEDTLRYLSEAYKYDPDWKEVKERMVQLNNFFSDICQRILSSSSIKPNKKSSIIENLKCVETKLRKQYENCDEMCNGTVKLAHELNEGANNCILPCKIISYTSDMQNIFLCSVFYAIDSSGNSIALFIYDLVKNKGPRTGDSVIIIRPYLKYHRIKYHNKEYTFQAIKIVNPLQDIYVNNKRINADAISVPVVNVTLKSD